MKEFIFTSYDGKKLNCSVWDEVQKPIGTIQILHGMAEHSSRYDDFARYLNKNGYIVFADDHRAHGKTAEKLGYDKGDNFSETVRDEIEITKYLKNTYHLPIVVMGHSYGSFLNQSYIQKNGLNIAGAVLCGSAYLKDPTVKVGSNIANLMSKFNKKDKPSNFLNKLSFGAFNKPFKTEGDFGWLSRDRNQVQKYIDDDQCGQVMSLSFFKSMIGASCKLYNQADLNKIPKNLPIRIMSGGCDPVGGKNNSKVKKLYEMYKNLGIEDVTFQSYENARHEILNETNNQDVYKDTLDFFNKVMKKADKKNFRAPNNVSKKKLKKKNK